MNNNEGFTLVEVIAAITILLIVGLGFFQFFVKSQEGSVESSERLAALNVAQQVMEQIKQREYKGEGITGEGTYACDSLLSVEKCQFTIDGNVYEINIGIEVHEYDLYLVKVEVYDEHDELKSSVQALVPAENF